MKFLRIIVPIATLAIILVACRGTTDDNLIRETARQTVITDSNSSIKDIDCVSCNTESLVPFLRNPEEGNVMKIDSLFCSYSPVCKSNVEYSQGFNEVLSSLLRS